MASVGLLMYVGILSKAVKSVLSFYVGKIRI